MSNLVRYGSYSLDALDRDVATSNAVSGGAFMDLEPGENVVRFLPPPVGKDSPFRITALHYVDAVPGLEKMIVFACPRVELKQPCVVCAKVAELNATGSPLDRDRAFRISASLRIYANVVDRKHPEGGVKVLGFGKMIQAKLKTIRASGRLGGDFTDPTEKGFDVIITREGEGKLTKYDAYADRAATPLAPTEDEIMAILESQHDLEQFVNPMTPEELLRVWGQASGRGPATPRQVEVPARPVPLGPRVGASVMAAARAPAFPVSRSAVQDATGAPTSVLSEDPDDFPPSYKR